MTTALALLLLAPGATAHYSLTHVKSQIACNYYAQDGINWMANPIEEGAGYFDWWMHGQVGCQDRATDSFELPANGETQIAMSSRVQYVSPPWGDGAFNPADPDYVPSREEWGDGPDSIGNTIFNHHNIHAYSRDDTSGCALAIAYKSDVTAVTPEDLVVFNVIHDCPKRQRETIAVPNLPACPNDQCICVWLWIPRNSGAKNWYMTPFQCTVTGARADASPIDYAMAIPPRRCLNPENCNFGPRLPLFWMPGSPAWPQINMPENNKQSPSYSIVYGFREGAQHDIFVNTNPRRHLVEETPAESRCPAGNEASRVTEGSTWGNLTSPDCSCTARNSGGAIQIFRGDRAVATVSGVGGGSPRDIVDQPAFKASRQYFPASTAPYRMDLDDRCYIYITDSDGVVVWESMFNESPYPHSNRWGHWNWGFTGESADPAVWPMDGVVYDGR